jgi:GR25 family glycosyltransferase involved in LPS biosynthesis
MRVGITTLIEFSVFSAGVNNMSIALAELMAGLGHEAVLLNVRGRKDWWDDCKALQKNFKVEHLDGKSPNDPRFDILLEVGGLTVTPQQRAALATTAIWVLRKPFVVSETEMSIYPVGVPARDTTGIKQAWLLTDVVSSDDASAVETLTRVPVLQVPFVWSPLPAEAHYRSIGAPVWAPDASDNLFDVHMVDTNMTSASSSTLSLVILREIARRRLPIGSWALHNGEAIAKSKFFRENVLKHCSDLDLSGACVGRQRCVEWTGTRGAVAMAHLRFMRLRPVLLDLAWVGIPTIHNSLALRDVGEGAERLYYSDNSVCGGADAFQRMVGDLAVSAGWFAEGAAERRREGILRRWSPLSPLVKSIWGSALQQFAGTSGPAVPAAPAAVAATPSVIAGSAEPKTFRIVFANMWADFNPAYNFFTLLLNAAGKHMSPPVSVEGYADTDWQTGSKGNPDLVIFGPFGNDWLRYDASVPRVCYTGENTGPVEHPSVKLNMGHEMTYMKSDYLRVPHWVLSVNWFGADVDRLVNPRPIPLELCVRASFISTRPKFAAFVVSNPKNPVRNLAFDWVNSYKPVDSGGMLYNNIGDQLAAGLGGGGGEWKKVKFYQDYRFVLAYENGSNKGYCTEKYLHAKAAGAVPIYWGDPDFQRDFDPAGCIDARQCRTRDDLVALVRAVEENPEEWAKRAAVPAFDDYKVGLARRLLSEAAGRIFGILGAGTEGIPRFLGAEPGSAEAKVGMEYFRAPAAPAPASAAALTPSKPELPILATFTSLKFLGSLQHWLKSIAAQARVLPELRAMVFLHNDVPADTVAKLKETYAFATFEGIPHEWHPKGFSDFWAPMNYAWKLWLFHHLAHLESMSGRLFFYIDSGACLVRFPRTLLAAAATAGVACLEDPREENDRWCSEQFCEELAVTDDERAQKQIVGGILAFRAGDPAAVRFFDEAFALGQKRHLIVGPKIGGLSLDGKCYGHRHDQSILSILVRRHAVPLIPLDEVYCQTTMRETFLSGRSIYVHRGNFAKHIAFLPGIQEAHVINLDRRADRLKRFWENHPGLEERVVRCSAVDGRSLTLTPTLARLFRSNDFFWKKSVMGCAMSHLSLWWRLVNDTPDINNYLIFEDDAKMVPGWEETVVAAMATAPEDYDVLFLGGILPPNRSAFETVIRPVNEYWSQVRPNQIFGQPRPTSYFHTCAYAYVLSRTGAIKVLDSIRERDGYWTSADHMLCNRVDEMNIYFLNTKVGEYSPVAACYQDDDPKYANADFNNFSRVDEFDSDLWNNDERFSKEEVVTALGGAEGPFDVATSLRAVFGKPGASAASAPQPPQEAIQAQPKPVEGVRPPLAPMLRGNSQIVPARIVSFKEHPIDFNAAYERDWLMTLWGSITHVNLYTMAADDPPPDDCPIVLLQRPHVPAITRILRTWSDAGATFRILHLSDEHVVPEHQDPLVAYTFKGCHSILRNYIRADIPEGAEEKVSVIPLGYRWSPKIDNDMRVAEHTPQVPFREFHWSFFGTNWNGRAAALAPLLECKLHGNYKLLENWNDPSGLTREEYLGAMLDSVFVPCPDGNNPETFRFYEALQAGCIPLVVKTKRNEAWFNWVSKHLPLITNTSWQETIRIMVSLLTKPETLEIYRGQVLKAWAEWKTVLREQASQWLLSVA